MLTIEIRLAGVHPAATQDGEGHAEEEKEVGQAEQRSERDRVLDQFGGTGGVVDGSVGGAGEGVERDGGEKLLDGAGRVQRAPIRCTSCRQVDASES